MLELYQIPLMPATRHYRIYFLPFVSDLNTDSIPIPSFISIQLNSIRHTQLNASKCLTSLAIFSLMF